MNTFDSNTRDSHENIRHETIQDALPAFRQRQVSAEQAAIISAHIAQCDECRRELGFIDRLRNYLQRKSIADESLQLLLQKQKLQSHLFDDEEMKQPEQVYAMVAEREQRNFDTLWQRIEQSQANENSDRSALKIRSNADKKLKRWVAFAVAASFLLIAQSAWRQTLFTQPSFTQTSQAPAAEYRTLSNTRAAEPCGAVHVRFVDNLAASELQYLMNAVDAQIIDGPSTHGVYTLRVPVQQRDVIMRRLHEHPSVLLVEPTSC